MLLKIYWKQYKQ